MKHLKKFENFDLGHRFSDEMDEHDNEMEFNDMDSMEDDCEQCDDEMGDDYDFESEMGDDYDFESEMEEDSDREEMDWNDEEDLKLERVKSFRQFESKKSKPDFLDLDKDGNKKESMKKAAKDAKKEDKDGKGLTAAQKKLPEGLRKAIEKRKKK